MNRWFSLVFLCAACGHVQVRDTSDDEAAIRARLQKWVEQFNSGDYTGRIARWIDAAPEP